MPIRLDDFRQEVRAFLDANATARQAVGRARTWGVGSDQVAIFSAEPTQPGSPELQAARDWQRARFDSGLAWITGPSEYGGRGLAPAYELAYNALEAEYDVPDTTDLRIVGIHLVAPTILAHGSPVQRELFVRALFRGDLIACQLFSEPGAGSDLASLQTRAVRDGSDWVINGQKVWTSVAHCSDIGELLCRTDAQAPKHQGITAFLVDMDSPGVQVRPLTQMTGGAEFNEVFFTDVRVPDSRRLGEVNDGWKVAITTLMNERSAVGSDDTLAANDSLNIGWLMSLLGALGRGDDPVARRGVSEIYARRATTEYVNARLTRALQAGQTPGPEASIAKLMNTRNVTEAAEFVADLLGPRLVADNGDWGAFSWTELLLSTPALRLLGGTDEIMKNILAERVLGLPKDSPSEPAKGGSA